MRKIHITRQFFEATGPQGHFFEKTKTRFQVWSSGVCVPNFRSVSFFVVPKRRRTDRQNHKPTYLQVKIGRSSTGCSPHVDFDIQFLTYVPKNDYKLSGLKISLITLLITLITVMNGYY